MWVANAVSPIGVETPEATRASDAISMDAQTTGAKAANFFAGFTSPALTISTAFGHNYAKATDNATQTFISNYACRDSEVTARMGVGSLCLRYDPVTTKAICLFIGNAGTVSVGVTSGMSTTSQNSSQPSYTHSSAQTNISLAPFGWTTLSQTDTYTLGASGLDVYVKWNGVEVFRYKEYLVIDPGYCLIWAHSVYSGISDLSVAYLQAALIGSNRAKKVIDLRDMGVLKSTLTTGSMSAGSNQLTVASAAGLAVGDPVIVEIGGEAGGGQRGTKGVGGTSPASSYATTSALLAATPADSTWAWAEDTGQVYAYQAGAWSQNTFPLYTTNYTTKALPRALRATITAIAGNVLTLSATAVVATTSARVHFDNINSFPPLTSTSSASVQPYGLTLKIPAGDYALGNTLPMGSKRHGWTLAGAGNTLTKLFSPKGVVCFGLAIQQSDYVTFKDMAWEGNHKLGNDGLAYGYQMQIGDAVGAENYPLSFSADATTGVICNDIAIRDVMRASVNFSTGFNNRANRCTLYMEAPVAAYTQWYFASNSGTGDEFRDCQVLYCPSLIKSFEGFGSINAKFVNCGGYNVLGSSNSAGGTVYDGFHSDIYGNSFYQVNGGYPGEPILSINRNAYPGSPLNTVGGQVINPRIIQHAKINYQAGGSEQAAIKIAGGMANWSIKGQYTGASTPFSAALGGYLEAPDWASGDYGFGAVGVICNGDDCTIDGIRVVGLASGISQDGGASHFENIYVQGAARVTVSNCIGDTYSLASGTTKSGNRTNAGVSVP